MRLRPVSNGFAFHCPGCDHAHVFFTSGPVTWSFNGNTEHPTFMPSLLNTCDNHVDPKQRRCHLHLTLGTLAFGADCSHDLAGQTVDLPEWPHGPEWGDP